MVCSTLISYMSFVVVRTSALNSDTAMYVSDHSLLVVTALLHLTQRIILGNIGIKWSVVELCSALTWV